MMSFLIVLFKKIIEIKMGIVLLPCDLNKMTKFLLFIIGKAFEVDETKILSY